MAITVERSPVPQQEQKPSNSVLWELPLWLYGFLSFVILLVCLLQFHSWISIEQGASPNAKNTFASPFYVVDEGYLSVLDVSVGCEYLTQAGNHQTQVVNFAERLTFKQRQLLPCAKSIPDNPEGRGSTSLTVTVLYRVAWLPLHRSETFRLKSAALADGTYLWIQEK